MLTIFKLIVISSVMTSIIFAAMKLAEKIFVREIGLYGRSALAFAVLFQPSAVMLAMLFREFNRPKPGRPQDTFINMTEIPVMSGTPDMLPKVHESVSHTHLADRINAAQIMEITAYVWLFAAAALLLFGAVRYFKFKSTLEKSFIREIDNNISELRIVSSGIVSSPFLIGVFKPVIVVPEMEFSESELYMTVRHETIHFRRHDIIKKIAVNFLRCVNWFNPVFYILEKQAGEMSEFIADEILTANAEYSERKEYGNMLLKFAENEACGTNAFSRLSGNALKLAKRLEFIMKNKPRKKLNKALVIIGAAAATAIIGVSAHAMAGVDPITTSRPYAIPEDKIVEFYPIEQQPENGYSLIGDVGVKYSEDIISNSNELFFFPEETEEIYEFDITQADGAYALEKLVSKSGQTMIIGAENGDGFWLNGNQKCTLKMSTVNISDSGATTAIGYIYNGKASELYFDKIRAGEFSLEFTAPKAGEYKFYIQNCCAGLQHYEYITIEKHIAKDKIVEAQPIEQQPAEGFSPIKDFVENYLEAVNWKTDDGEIFPTLNVYVYNSYENEGTVSVKNVAYTNGQVIFLDNANNCFEFEEGESAVIKILADHSPEYSNIDGKGELLEIGYVYDNTLTELYFGRIGDSELSVDFTADKAGIYGFYVLNCCADMQNYEYIKVEREQNE